MAKQIPLTQGLFSVVDEEDFDKVMQNKWHAVIGANGSYYAQRWTTGVRPRKVIRLSHFILGITELPRGQLVDHKNRDSLDNTKNNLRITNKSVNAYNTDRSEKGSFIYYIANRGTWKACVPHTTNPLIAIGTFKTYEEALQAQKIYKELL